MEFTDRQREVMAHAWRCFDAEPKVNYEKLAASAGFANRVSAKAFWHKIKTKLVSMNGSAGRCGTTSKPSGIASRQRGRSQGSKSTSTKRPKQENDMADKKLKSEGEDARLPMQSIPLVSGLLNDRSGHFNGPNPQVETVNIANVSIAGDIGGELCPAMD